ncbi:MAG TPA: hypothetical protein PKM88_02895 [bacterium]|nr:hypothetical protein [bacterium]
MIKAGILLSIACAGAIGAVISVLAAIAFAIKKRRRNACISVVLAFAFAIGSTVSAFQFVTKSFRAVDRFMTEQAENSYDISTPDAIGNRKGFEHHFTFAPDTSVSNVYYYADELGADCQYQLSFKCDTATIERIINTIGLVEVTNHDTGLPPRADFTWWTPNSTKGRTLWVKETMDEYYWELWYSETDGTAFYHEYSI